MSSYRRLLHYSGHAVYNENILQISEGFNQKNSQATIFKEPKERNSVNIKGIWACNGLRFL